MGNTCQKSGTVDFVGTPPVNKSTAAVKELPAEDVAVESIPVGNNNNNVESIDGKKEEVGAAYESNNNVNDEHDKQFQSHQQCLEYVNKALEEQKLKQSAVKDYSESLLEISGEELLFNFEDVEIKEELDEMDGMVRFDTIDFPTVAINVPDVGASAGDQDEDEIEVDTRSTTWYGERSKEFDYTIPDDKYSTVTEEKLDLRNTKKTKIIALSDLHLGGSWSKGMDWKLERYLNGIIESAKEEVACFVMLGDIFEMWLEKFAEVPPANETRVEKWKESADVLIKATSKLVSECEVKVFYVRGNHDREITEEDITAVFGGQVKFVPCTLVLRLQTGSEVEHRVRLAHGHEWDVFNSYMLQSDKKLLPNKPIGYYIARAVATAGGADAGSELEDLLIGLASGLLSFIPSSLEDDLVDCLLSPDTHKKLLSRLFEGAFQVEDVEFLEHAKCRVNENQFIRLKTLLEYPLLRLCGSAVGKKDVFHMIKAATGDYKKFIKGSDEDVIVLAHTHRWDLRKYKNYRGNQVVYANTGCWTCNAEEFSTVIINPPTEEADGSVVIDYGKNDQEME